MSLATLPIVVPLVTAVLCLLAWRRPALQRVFGVIGAAALCAVGAALVHAVLGEGRTLIVHVGGWQPPFAISLVADPLSALMVAVTGVVALCGAVYSLGDIGRGHMAFGYFPLFHFLMMGVCGAFLTADMFNLFVWFEVILITSFVLLAMGGQRLQMTGAIKYVAINLVSSALFLVAVGILYAVCHSLSMLDLPQRLAVVAESDPSLVVAMAALFAVSFGIKAGLFPLFSWLPASYHNAPPAISAVFAGLLTKVGVYALLRIFSGVFPPMDGVYAALLLGAGATMVVGVLGAVAQGTVRRILGFHIISQIGYIAVGVGLLAAPTPELVAFAVAAAIFYTLHHILVKTNLFLIAGVIERMSGTGRLDRLGGLAKRAPWLAILFLIPALSLAGIPPLSGFWAKLATFKAVLASGGYLVAAAAAVAG
ncbi:MAG: proton-conducting transporter membrane subunit, partial [Myxococcota bacterium]